MRLATTTAVVAGEAVEAVEAVEVSVEVPAEVPVVKVVKVAEPHIPSAKTFCILSCRKRVSPVLGLATHAGEYALL